MTSFFANLWRAYVRHRNSKRRWAQRTVYTYRPRPDERAWSDAYMNDLRRWTR
jgi:hypothetical protein